jgi:hypothetical protein
MYKGCVAFIALKTELPLLVIMVVFVLVTIIMSRERGPKQGRRAEARDEVI